MLCLVAQSRLTLCDPWTAARQAPLSVGFSRQEYWSGLPCPALGYLPNPGIEPRCPALQADSLLSEPPGKPILVLYWHIKTNGLPSSSVGKESTCNAGDSVRFLGPEDPLEKGMTTHSSILAWRIPWTV